MAGKTQYMIHACLKRMWYVNDFIIPSMLEQGIDRGDIEVWLDEKREGCLKACMECFREVSKRGSGRWHLQDDILISADFAEKTREFDDGIVAGYCNDEFGPDVAVSGRCPAVFLWNSFPCIRLPDEIAGECVEWVYNEATKRPKYQTWFASGKRDDSFFHDFLDEVHERDWYYNLKPNIVEHVDFLIGGSVANKYRGHQSRASFWTDENRVEELKARLATRA